MREPWSWTWFLVGLLDGLFRWVVLPMIASVLMGVAFVCAIVWLRAAITWLLWGRHEPGFALFTFGGAVVAAASGVALAWFLYHQYLVPIASQVGR
jgi:hypothetical protein